MNWALLIRAVVVLLQENFNIFLYSRIPYNFADKIAWKSLNLFNAFSYKRNSLWSTCPLEKRCKQSQAIFTRDWSACSPVKMYRHPAILPPLQLSQLLAACSTLDISRSPLAGKGTWHLLPTTTDRAAHVTWPRCFFAKCSIPVIFYVTWHEIFLMWFQTCMYERGHFDVCGAWWLGGY